MAGWNGSGTFSRTHNWTQDQGNGILIRADRHDANDTDFVNGINNCITKDGQNTPTADLPMATYKHTGVGNATARNQYAAAGQIQDQSFVWCGTAGGTANALTLTPSPAITAYAAGQSFVFKAGASASTSTATVAISGLSTIAIQFNGAALVGGEIEANKFYRITLDTASTAQLEAFSSKIFNDGINIVGNNKKLYFDGGTNDFSFRDDGTNLILRAETAGGDMMVFANSTNVSIGSSAPHASAVLDLPTTTKAFRPPVMTTAQKSAISSPQQGFEVHDTDLDRPAWYNGAAWEHVIFGKRFTSSNQTITGGGSLTLAHGLGTTPFLIQAWLVCTSAELGYSTNDKVPTPINICATTGSSQGVVVIPDGTNLNVRFGNGTPPIVVLRKDTGAAAGITTGNWNIYFEAYA